MKRPSALRSNQQATEGSSAGNFGASPWNVRDSGSKVLREFKMDMLPSRRNRGDTPDCLGSEVNPTDIGTGLSRPLN